MSNERVPYQVELPNVQDFEHLRRTLSDILERHATEINHTAFDSTTVSSSTVVASDIVIVETNSATVAVTLVPAAEWRDRVLRIKRVGTNPVLIVPQTGETIDQTATATIGTSLFTFQVVSDGVNWWIV